MMTTFTKIIDKFRREAWSERDKGFRFERLMQAYLKTTSLYAGRFEEVWLWSEFPCHDQFGGKDIGIDLVPKPFLVSIGRYNSNTSNTMLKSAISELKNILHVF